MNPDNPHDCMHGVNSRNTEGCLKMRKGKHSKPFASATGLFFYQHYFLKKSDFCAPFVMSCHFQGVSCGITHNSDSERSDG